MKYGVGGVISNPEIFSRVHNLIHMLTKQFYDVKGSNTSMLLTI